MDMNSYKTSSSVSRAGANDILAQGFMTKVYLWMTFGLLVTAGVSYCTATSRQLLYMLFGRGMVPFIVLVVIELGIVVYMSRKVMTLNPSAASVLFFAYAALNGLTLAPVFLVYTEESIYSAFLTSALMFGAMSVYGTVTKRSLTEWRSFLMMGLIGLIAAGLINLFAGSERANLVISIIGVIVFIGLTAYDTQRLRLMASELADGDNLRGSFAVLGALSLYLDFVNIFLYLLRIFGKRR